MALQLDDRPDETYNDDEELERLEKLFASDAASDEDLPENHPSRSDTATPEELKNTEEDGNNSSLNYTGDDGDQPTGRLAGLRQKAQKVDKRAKGISEKLRNNKWLFGLGAMGGGAAIIVLLLIVAVFSNYKIIHLAENVTVYNMARTAREFREAASQNTAEAIDAEATSETRLAQLQAKYENSKIKVAIDTINTYRPASLLKKLNANLEPVFEEGPPSKILGRPTKVFKGWDYNGVLIEKTDRSFGQRFFHPVESYNDRLRFGAELNALLEEDFGATNSIVRGKVIRSFMESRGISKLRWWSLRGKKFQGLTNEAAENLNATQSYNQNRTPRSTCATSEICNAVDEAAQASDEAVKSGEGLTASQLEEKVADRSARTITANIGGKLESVVSKTSIIYSVALPLCLIYDGSLQNAKDTIDNSEDANRRTFFMVRTAADQMKAGATREEAVSGLSGQLGDIKDSVPLRRASGENIDSASEVNATALPQSTSVGTYSLFNAFLGDILSSDSLDLANTIATKGCGVVTNIWTGVTLTVAEGALFFVTGGLSSGAEEGAATGVRALIAQVSERTLAKLGLQQGVREAGIALTTKAVAKAGSKLFVKIALQTGAILGATELAKLSVIKHMNAANNGLATNATLANQVDMGGNLYAQDTNRKFLFGRPLTKTEVAESKVADADYLKESNQRKSIQERYFALDNPQSLMATATFNVGSFITGSGFNAGSLMSYFESGLSHIPKQMASVLLSRPAFAAATTSGAGDYNIVQWGYSKEELDLIDNNAAYAPLDNDLALDGSGKAEEIEKTYSKCYDKTDGELLSEGLIVRTTNGEVVANQGDCSPVNLGLRNPQYGDLVFRWRLAKRNQNVREHLIDMQNAN